MDRRLNWRHTMILASALGLVGLWGCESTTAPEESVNESVTAPLPPDGGEGSEPSDPLKRFPL